MRRQRLLLAISIAVAVAGFVGLIVNIKAALQSDIASSEAPTRSLSTEASKEVSNEVETPSTPVAEATPSPSAEPSTSPSPSPSPTPSLASKKPQRSKQELAQLLKKSQQEARICRESVAKARAKLSKSLMSAEEFKQALRTLEETYLTPPSSQQIFSAFEKGNPSDWDGSSFLEDAISAGGCDVVIHYKLLKSVVEKAAQHPERFPREEIRSAAKAFLTIGAKKPSPLSTELTRISLLQDLVKNKEVDASFEQKVSELQQMAQGLADKIQEDVHACQNAPDCLKSLPNEFEQSQKVREAYLKLIKEI
jgi:hypothetical protein